VRKQDAPRAWALTLAVLFPGASLIVALGWAFKWFEEGGFLERWQTLIGSLIAILAAVIGAYYVQQQIWLAKAQEQERIDRRYDASRAILSLTLSSVILYARACTNYLKPILVQSAGGAIPTTAIPTSEPPQIPPETVTQLRDMIEAAPKAVRIDLSRLLTNIQIEDARLADLPEGIVNPSRIVTKSNIESYILGAAEIYAICEQFFQFARREVDKPSINLTNNSLSTALHVLGFPDYEYGPLHAQAERLVNYRAQRA